MSNMYFDLNKVGISALSVSDKIKRLGERFVVQRGTTRRYCDAAGARVRRG